MRLKMIKEYKIGESYINGVSNSGGNMEENNNVIKIFILNIRYIFIFINKN